MQGIMFQAATALMTSRNFIEIGLSNNKQLQKQIDRASRLAFYGSDKCTPYFLLVCLKSSTILIANHILEVAEVGIIQGIYCASDNEPDGIENATNNTFPKLR
jgi:hypothetical protein